MTNDIMNRNGNLVELNQYTPIMLDGQEIMANMLFQDNGKRNERIVGSTNEQQVDDTDIPLPEKDFSGVTQGDFSCIQKKEDFYQPNLYDEIYKIKGNRERRVTIAQIAEKARRIGKTSLVTEFKALCKETEKEIKEKKRNKKDWQ